MSTVTPDDDLKLSSDNRRRVEAVLSRLSSARVPDQVVLAVFGLGSYGDALQITSLLQHLRERFVTARIVLIHPNGAVPALLAGSGLIDQVCVAPSIIFNPLRHQLLVQGLVDLVVNCRYVIEYVLPSNSRLAGAERAFVEAAQVQQQRWLPLTESFPFDNDLLWRAAAKDGMNMYALMAATSGFAGADFEALRIALAPEDFALRRELPERYIVVGNSAEALTVTRSNWTKTLPMEKMARIVKKMKRLGVPLVLLGATTDDAPVDGVDYDWRGRSTLRQAAAILKDAALYVAPEGGLANLAKAVGTRGVVFFGSTPPAFFAFRDNINIQPQLCGGCWWTTPSYLYHCPRLQRAPECVGSISEDDVVLAVRRLLA